MSRLRNFAASMQTRRSNPQHDPSAPREFAGRESTSLDVVDVGLFVLCSALVSLLAKLGVHAGLIPNTDLSSPPFVLHIGACLVLLACLYWTIRIRHGSGAWGKLGWRLPHRPYLWIALAGGTILGITVGVIARSASGIVYPVPTRATFLVGMSLGPILEESFFSGCILPVLGRATRGFAAVLITAMAFATMHIQPGTHFLQWACIAGTGAAYAGMRLVSRSTVASVLMHVAYNSTLFFMQFPPSTHF
jgi:membrane protease YdiL (CAAX protease family)